VEVGLRAQNAIWNFRAPRALSQYIFFLLPSFRSPWIIVTVINYFLGASRICICITNAWIFASDLSLNHVCNRTSPSFAFAVRWITFRTCLALDILFVLFLASRKGKQEVAWNLCSWWCLNYFIFRSRWRLCDDDLLRECSVLQEYTLGDLNSQWIQSALISSGAVVQPPFLWTTL